MKRAADLLKSNSEIEDVVLELGIAFGMEIFSSKESYLSNIERLAKDVDDFNPMSHLQYEMKKTMSNELEFLKNNPPNFGYFSTQSHSQFTKLKPSYAGYIRGEVIRLFKKNGISFGDKYNLYIDASFSNQSYIYIPKKKVLKTPDKA